MWFRRFVHETHADTKKKHSQRKFSERILPSIIIIIINIRIRATSCSCKKWRTTKQTKKKYERIQNLRTLESFDRAQAYFIYGL